MIGLKLLQSVHICFNVYMTLIVVRCLLTWFPNLDWDNPILSGLKASVDLYLDFFRKFIPPVGPFDFSPVVAMFVLIIIERPILWLFAQVFSLMGLLG